MPKYYCDYCNIYLTHDTVKVRRDHNSGWKHALQVKLHFMQHVDQQQLQWTLNDVIGEYSRRGEAPPPPPGVNVVLAPVAKAPIMQFPPLPPGVTLPPLPPGMSLPPGIVLPPGIALPPGVTLPPGMPMPHIPHGGNLPPMPFIVNQPPVPTIPGTNIPLPPPK